MSASQVKDENLLNHKDQLNENDQIHDISKLDDLPALTTGTVFVRVRENFINK